MNATIDDRLRSSIRELLEDNTDGFTEYELLKRLGAGNDQIMSDAFRDQLSIFRAHFLLFHILYGLRDQLWQAQQGHLSIHPLRIQLFPYCAAQAGLAVPDSLRSYYLDLTHLEKTSAAQVQEMLNSFFVTLQRSDGRTQALAALGLQDPVEDNVIKQTYRRLAMRHHPDRGGDTQKLQVINDAVQRLLGSR